MNKFTILFLTIASRIADGNEGRFCKREER